MSPPPVRRFLHDVSHRSVSSLGRPGAARGFSRRNVAFQGAPDTRRRVQAPVRFGWPADAGPVTRAPRSGGATFRGAGPIWMDGAAGCGEPCPAPVTRPARVPRGPRRAARVSGVRLPLRRRLRQDGAPVRQPGRGEPHRRPRQPARQRHDPAPARTPVAGAHVLHGPPRQRAVRLVVEPAPGHPRQVLWRHRAAGLAYAPVAVHRAARPRHRPRPGGTGRSSPSRRAGPPRGPRGGGPPPRDPRPRAGAPAGSPRTRPRTPASRGHPRRRRRRPAPAPAKASRAARPPP